MLSYLEIALINSVIIFPIALLAGASSRAFRRPALTHLLWVLILVKLVTPPVWQIPLVDREWLKSAGRQLLPKVVFDVDHFELSPRPSLKIGDEAPNVSKLKSRPRTLAGQEFRPETARVSITSVVVSCIRSENFWQLVQLGLLIVWSLGALIWFVVQGARCVRFRWSLQRGFAAGAELQRYSDRLARRLGLSYSPTVWLMPGVMSPMLWGNGESLLLIFPEQMLDRLDEAATGTLLTHELAHVRRRDHWVRVIALLTTGFFWWHPVVWWARREIEAAEEECCDALVVASAAAAPKRYAEAILEVIDFLAARHPRLPALATGLGQVPFLRQRLTWIMRGPRRHDFGYCGRMLCLFLACMLPLQPSWLSARSVTANSDVPPTSSLRRGEMTPAPGSPVTHVSEMALADATSLEKPNTQSQWIGLEVKSHSSDGRFVVMGNRSTQCLFDLNNGREFELTDFVILAMAFTPSSHEFVTIGQDGFLRLWNAEIGEVIYAWRIPGDSAKSVDVSSDGEWIATGGRDGIVRIWNRSSPQPVRELARELAPVHCVRFSPDQDLLAVATGESITPQRGRIALIETLGWSEQISMNWNSPAAAVAFPRDGGSLISGDWQGRVARWSIASGELQGLSEGHQDLMASAEFSSSGSPLLEIEVPDLKASTTWDRPKTNDSIRWFFSGWRLKPSGKPTLAPKSGLP